MGSGFLTTTRQFGGVEVRTWESGAGPVSEDALVVVGFADRVRVACLDGVTATPATPREVGVVGGVWASGVIGTGLRSDTDPGVVLETVNAYLNREGLNPREQQQATAVVADVVVSGPGVLSATVFLAGDCEAWVHRVGGAVWEPVPAPAMVDPTVMAGLVEWRQANPGITREQNQAAEREALGSPDVWGTTPVGRFPTLKLCRVEVEDLDGLVLATDGGLLTADRVGNLDEWLMGLRDFEETAVRDGVRFKKADDVSVAYVRLV